MKMPPVFHATIYFVDIYLVNLIYVSSISYCIFLCLKVLSHSLPVGVASAHGLDVDGYNTRPDWLARNGGYLCSNFPA